MIVYKPKTGYTYNPMCKIPRNDPCPCQSGKKYKKCCMNAISRYIPLSYAKRMEGKNRTEQFIIYVEYSKKLTGDPK